MDLRKSFVSIFNQSTYLLSAYSVLGKDKMHSSESTKEDSGDLDFVRGHSRVSSKKRPQGMREQFFLLKDVGQLIHFTIW